MKAMIDLFAGCGGLSLGMEQAGFTPVLVNELNRDAMRTYLMNRHHTLGGIKFSDNKRLHSYDITSLDNTTLNKIEKEFKKIPEVSYERTKNGSNIALIAGGPPCQGFSTIGHRRSYAVDKANIPSNHLYSHMSRVIQKFRPCIFLFENVAGILSSSWVRGGSNIFEDVLAEFRSIPGYQVRWSLVRAKDYGVPQNRPRVLLVGIRDDILCKSPLIDLTQDSEDAVQCGFLPEGCGGAPDIIDLISDLCDPLIDNALRAGNIPAGKLETTRYPEKPFLHYKKS